MSADATDAGGRVARGALAGRLVAPCRLALGAVVELLLPEHCAACGVGVAFAPWTACGPCAAGLRPWDRPHLCAGCAARLFGRPCEGRLEGGDGCGADLAADALPVVAAAATSALLADVVGTWKYDGVRGLGWPLGRALAGALRELARAGGEPFVLAPVPLHPARRRRRGFNQAEMLALLAGQATGVPVAANALRRRRATAQQARLVTARDREANLAGAFVASPPPAAARRVVLVDDLVTAGATARAAAAALAAAGWDVAGVVALGLATARDDGDGAHVDTPEDDL